VTILVLHCESFEIRVLVPYMESTCAAGTPLALTQVHYKVCVVVRVTHERLLMVLATILRTLLNRIHEKG
jgi:hypothetical protein